MTRIFNIRTNEEFHINDQLSNIFFTPADWDIDNPYVKFLFEDYDWIAHIYKYANYKSFYNSIGSYSKEWHIEFLGKTKKLNLEDFGSNFNQSHLIRTYSDDFNGTVLKLNIDTDTIDSLSQSLEMELEIENYEKCALLRDKIDSLRDLKI